ncbi:hypothetical protein D9M69_430720 [compost metagenome]
MDHAGVVRQRGRHAGGAQLGGVGGAFVMQRVVARHGDPGRAHIAHIGAGAATVERGEAPVVAARFPVQVLREEPADHFGGQQVALGQCVVRWRVLARAGAGVQQHLQHGGEPRVARLHGAGRGQRAAGAVAAQRDAGRVGTQPPGLGKNPVQRVEGVVDRGRKAPLRPEAVIHRQHHAVGPAAQQPAQRIVRIDAADRKAAAVEVHQQRQRLGPAGLARRVQPRRDGMAVTRGHVQVFGCVHGGRADVEDRRAFLVGDLGVLRVQCVDRRPLGAGDQFQQLRHLRVERSRRQAGRLVGGGWDGGHEKSVRSEPRLQRPACRARRPHRWKFE